MDCTIITNLGKLISVHLDDELDPNDKGQFEKACGRIHAYVRKFIKSTHAGSYQVRSIGAYVVDLNDPRPCICA